jgi:hypothetical protein
VTEDWMVSDSNQASGKRTTFMTTIRNGIAKDQFEKLKAGILLPESQKQ